MVQHIVVKATDVLMKRKLLIIIAMLCGIVLAIISLKVISPRYKVTAQISLPSQYFQNPLVRDFLPETWDAGELRSLRETLIHSTFTPEVVRDLGIKYKLFPGSTAQMIQTEGENAVSTYEVNEIKKRIELIWIGSASFLLAFNHSDPQVAFNVLEDVMAIIRAKLVRDRKNTLIRLKNALQERLEAIAFGTQINNKNLLESRPDLVTEERKKLERDYQDLLQKYSEKHPLVTTIRNKLNELKKYETMDHPELIKPKFSSRDFSQVKIEGAAKELFEDLLKKYHYVEVVLYLDEQNQDGFVTVTQAPFIPKSPIWPKRSILVIWGAALGFMVGCALSFAFEFGLIKYVRRSKKPILA